MSSVLAAVKNFPSVRRRRRCDKQHLELYGDQLDVVPSWDSIPAPPITPPAAFLPGYKRLSRKGNPLILFFQKNVFVLFYILKFTTNQKVFIYYIKQFH